MTFFLARWLIFSIHVNFDFSDVDLLIAVMKGQIILHQCSRLYFTPNCNSILGSGAYAEISFRGYKFKNIGKMKIISFANS